MVTQSKYHRRDIILHSANECRMWVTGGDFSGRQRVPQALKRESEIKGEFGKINSVHSITISYCERQ